MSVAGAALAITLALAPALALAQVAVASGEAEVPGTARADAGAEAAASPGAARWLTDTFPMTPIPAEGATLEPALREGATFALRFYASARADVVVDGSPMQDRELPMWALSEDPALGGVRNGVGLSSHPFLTRVGASLDRWQLSEDVRLFARAEVDFLGETDSTFPQLRFRHAYAGLRVSHWALLLGHTNDLVAPLHPTVNDASMMWNAGNLGDRRAQLRASFEPEIGATRLRIATAAAVPSTVAEQDLDRDGTADGLAAALPVMGQGLVELQGHYWTAKRPFVIGASGHVAMQEVDDVSDSAPPPGAFDYDGARRLHGFSLVGHLQIPFSDNLWLRGEGFYGQNLPEVRGGIGETISLRTGQEVRAFGGWGELGVQARWWTGIVGGSVDHPLDGDVADGQRRRNATFFAASRFQPARSVTIAFEFIYWATAYQNAGAGTAQRANLWSSVDF